MSKFLNKIKQTEEFNRLKKEINEEVLTEFLKNLNYISYIKINYLNEGNNFVLSKPYEVNDFDIKNIESNMEEKISHYLKEYNEFPYNRTYTTKENLINGLINKLFSVNSSKEKQQLLKNDLKRDLVELIKKDHHIRIDNENEFYKTLEHFLNVMEEEGLLNLKPDYQSINHHILNNIYLPVGFMENNLHINNKEDIPFTIQEQGDDNVELINEIKSFLNINIPEDEKIDDQERREKYKDIKETFVDGIEENFYRESDFLRLLNANNISLNTFKDNTMLASLQSKLGDNYDKFIKEISRLDPDYSNQESYKIIYSKTLNVVDILNLEYLKQTSVEKIAMKQFDYGYLSLITNKFKKGESLNKSSIYVPLKNLEILLNNNELILNEENEKIKINFLAKDKIKEDIKQILYINDYQKSLVLNINTPKQEDSEKLNNAFKKQGDVFFKYNAIMHKNLDLEEKIDLAFEEMKKEPKYKI